MWLTYRGRGAAQVGKKKELNVIPKDVYHHAKGAMTD